MGEAGQSREGESITPVLVSIMALWLLFLGILKKKHTLIYAHFNEILFGVNITFTISVETIKLHLLIQLGIIRRSISN